MVKRLYNQGILLPVLPGSTISMISSVQMAQDLADQRAYITASSLTNSSGIGVELLPVEMTLDGVLTPFLREVIMKIND